MIAKGKNSLALSDILSSMTEADILSYYLNVNEVPTVINSPLREDKKPSLGFYSLNGSKIYFTDFSTQERGGLYDFLGKMWGCSYDKVLEKINKDKHLISKGHTSKKCNNSIQKIHTYSKNVDLQCKVREWKDYDIAYWESYGISLNWLKFAEVYPISHKIVVKDNKTYVFTADKYAYAYVERKDDKVTIKIYQPFNTLGYKWSNKNDGSVISLWKQAMSNKITNNLLTSGKGFVIAICSSLKDALCLWANTGIPAIALQGEGYKMSNTAVNELKKKFDYIYILFDSDTPGRIDSQKLAEETGFINLELPEFDGGKDISDYYKLYGKDCFLKLMQSMFDPPSFCGEFNGLSELPF